MLYNGRVRCKITFSKEGAYEAIDFVFIVCYNKI